MAYKLKELKNRRIQEIVTITISNKALNNWINDFSFNNVSVVLLVFLLYDFSQYTECS